MNRLWVIGDSKKVLFPGKSVFIFLLSYFCTLFSKNCLFATRPPFFESLITHKRFVFKESYISYGKRQKSCTLIVIWVKCLYLTSPIFNSSAKSNRLFFIANEEVYLRAHTKPFDARLSTMNCESSIIQYFLLKLHRLFSTKKLLSLNNNNNERTRVQFPRNWTRTTFLHSNCLCKFSLHPVAIYFFGGGRGILEFLRSKDPLN